MGLALPETFTPSSLHIFQRDDTAYVTLTEVTALAVHSTTACATYCPIYLFSLFSPRGLADAVPSHSANIPGT